MRLRRKPARQMGQDHAVVVELDAEQAAGEFFQNRAGYFDIVFFAHKPPGWIRLGGPARSLRSGAGPPDCSLAAVTLVACRPLGPLRHFKLHSGAFIQAAITLRLDRREMHEDVFSVLPLDEAVAFGCVKPLHCTFFFHLPIFLLCNSKCTGLRPAGSKQKRGCGWTHAAPLYLSRSGKQEPNATPLYNNRGWRSLTNCSLGEPGPPGGFSPGWPRPRHSRVDAAGGRGVADPAVAGPGRGISRGPADA